ncbi:MAG: permease, partial [Alphaproteobacteria bacterium]|nr:permease [Alphaproteobacteria bacterium]
MANSCCSPTPNDQDTSNIVPPPEVSPQASGIGTRIVKSILSTDRVVIGFAISLLGIALYDTSQTLPSIKFVLESLLEISPYLAISVAFAAYVKATGSDALIGRAFKGNTGKAVMVAAVLGAFSPFCSCGVIPLISALLASGVPLAPVMAFWLASPVIDPEMMIVTAGILGIEFSIAKAIAAISLGTMGGVVVTTVQRLGGFQDPLAASITVNRCSPAIEKLPRPEWMFWKTPSRRESFRNELGSSAWFLLRWLSIAFLFEGLMINNVPMETVGEWLANIENWAVPMAAIVGAPAYLNGYAAIPLADTLMQMGLQPGAALAFMVAGGATCIPAAIA